MNELIEKIKSDLNNGQYSFPAEVVKQLVLQVEIHANKINRIYQIWGVEPDEGDAVTNMIEAERQEHTPDVVQPDIEWEIQDDNDLSMEDDESV